MTEKWLSLTPNPPRTPVFYTLLKTHKPPLVGRPIISGCDGLIQRIPSFVDRLRRSAYSAIARLVRVSQRYERLYKLYGKDKSARRRYPSLHGRHYSLCTNMPREEGIDTVRQAYQDFYDNKPPHSSRVAQRNA